MLWAMMLVFYQHHWPDCHKALSHQRYRYITNTSAVAEVIGHQCWRINGTGSLWYVLPLARSRSFGVEGGWEEGKLGWGA